MRTVESISEYLDEVRELYETLESDFNAVSTDHLLFRGHHSAAWKLTPRLGRLSLRGATIPEAESELFRAFKAQWLPFVQREATSDWDVLAMAQHHGLATRLLDWTTNPLVALWFVVREPPLLDADGLPQDGAIVVVKADPADQVDSSKETDPFRVTQTRLFRPSHLNARIIAQGGWFSVHKYNVNGKRFSVFDGVAKYRDRIERFVVPSKRFAVLRTSLHRLGLNEATLFPDLDGLTKHLNWLHGEYSDEKKPRPRKRRRTAQISSAAKATL
jgi:hypothetical protein